VLSVRFVIRTSVRAAHRCRPWVARATRVMVELVESEVGVASSALTRRCPSSLTRYAIVGGVTASAFALARAFAGPGVSEVLAVVGAVSIGALVVWIAVRLVREAQHTSAADLPYQTRALIVATTQRIADSHRHLPSTRTLELVCDPQRILRSVRDPALFVRLLAGALRQLVLKRAAHALPALGTAREAVDVVVTGFSHARFIYDFETSARQLCAARAA
jgi:hypothetical protein